MNPNCNQLSIGQTGTEHIRWQSAHAFIAAATLRRIESIGFGFLFFPKKTKPTPQPKTSAARRISTAAALVFLFLSVNSWNSCLASMIQLSLTNSLGLPDTNVVRVLTLDSVRPVLADGTIVTGGGLPVRWYPGASGKLTNYLATGNYFLTNATGLGVIYRSPDNTSNTLAYRLSGLNTFETVIFTNNIYVTNIVGGSTLTNLSGVVTGNPTNNSFSAAGTNAILSIAPSTNGFASTTDVRNATNTISAAAIVGTVTNALNSVNNTLVVSTPGFGALNGIWSVGNLSGTLSGTFNGAVNGTNYSGLVLTNALATNAGGVRVVGNTVFVQTNSGGATLPNTTSLLSGNGSGGAVDSGVIAINVVTNAVVVGNLFSGTNYNTIIVAGCPDTSFNGTYTNIPPNNYVANTYTSWQKVGSTTNFINYKDPNDWVSTADPFWVLANDSPDVGAVAPFYKPPAGGGTKNDLGGNWFFPVGGGGAFYGVGDYVITNMVAYFYNPKTNNAIGNTNLFFAYSTNYVAPVIYVSQTFGDDSADGRTTYTPVKNLDVGLTKLAAIPNLFNFIPTIILSAGKYTNTSGQTSFTLPPLIRIVGQGRPQLGISMSFSGVNRAEFYNLYWLADNKTNVSANDVTFNLPAIGATNALTVYFDDCAVDSRQDCFAFYPPGGVVPQIIAENTTFSSGCDMFITAGCNLFFNNCSLTSTNYANINYNGGVNCIATAKNVTAKNTRFTIAGTSLAGTGNTNYQNTIFKTCSDKLSIQNCFLSWTGATNGLPINPPNWPSVGQNLNVAYTFYDELGNFYTGTNTATNAWSSSFIVTAAITNGLAGTNYINAAVLTNRQNNVVLGGVGMTNNAITAAGGNFAVDTNGNALAQGLNVQGVFTNQAGNLATAGSTINSVGFTNGAVTATSYGTAAGTNFSIAATGNGKVGGVGLTNGVITGNFGTITASNTIWKVRAPGNIFWSGVNLGGATNANANPLTIWVPANYLTNGILRIAYLTFGTTNASSTAMIVYAGITSSPNYLAYATIATSGNVVGSVQRTTYYNNSTNFYAFTSTTESSGGTPYTFTNNTVTTNWPIIFSYSGVNNGITNTLVGASIEIINYP